MARSHIKGDWEEARTFSPAVSTRGGRIVWLAGMLGISTDPAAITTEDTAMAVTGPTLAGDFDGQVRAVFGRIADTLERAGGQLSDIVTTTVFLRESRHGERFVELRRDFFPSDYPASALITVSGFPHPDMLVEVQAVAVVDDEEGS